MQNLLLNYLHQLNNFLQELRLLFSSLDMRTSVLYNKDIKKIMVGGFMKILASPIEMVAWFEKNGTPHPVRFRLTSAEKLELVIKVDKVVSMEKERLAGNEMYIFKCQSVVHGAQTIFELKYEFKSCKWMLWKM
jgi:hypothetical protein